jgi:ketosteroid isomerase-like protein
MSEMTEKNKQLIKDSFNTLFSKLDASEESVSQFFDKNYKQNVDGKTLDYKGFLQHIKVLFSQLESCRVEFEHIIAEGDKVCTVHYPIAVKKNGVKVKAEVHALFQINNGKIVLCHELTHLHEGEEKDRDLGSAT